MHRDAIPAGIPVNASRPQQSIWPLDLRSGRQGTTDQAIDVTLTMRSRRAGHGRTSASVSDGCRRRASSLGVAWSSFHVRQHSPLPAAFAVLALL